jgi:hypothetical protein
MTTPKMKIVAIKFIRLGRFCLGKKTVVLHLMENLVRAILLYKRSIQPTKEIF